MSDSIKIVHITAHLGGGIGKALSGLILNGEPAESRIRHTIICLEKPEKSLFVDRIVAGGGEVIVCPDDGQFDQLIADADIVQLEWWNHPVTISRLCLHQVPPMRLLVWCHVSGLHTPVIPKQLLTAADKFLFTSPCSYQAANVSGLLPEMSTRLGVVHSAGGFHGFPTPRSTEQEGVRAGYIGTLNFAKLHPYFVDFLKTVEDPAFMVKMIGDTLNQEILERQCAQAGRNRMLEFRGYTADVVSELSSVNTLVYLLNPLHYGTTENALLEAMAMGIVPIVLDNPAELHIVEDGKTGLVVRNPAEFGRAVQWLQENPDIRRQIGEQAAVFVRDRFNVTKMVGDFCGHYKEAMNSPKKTHSFAGIFGATPEEWFLSCQEDRAVFTEGKPVAGDCELYGVLERTKGSIFHFQRYFPERSRLSEWAEKMKSLQ